MALNIKPSSQPDPGGQNRPLGTVNQTLEPNVYRPRLRPPLYLWASLSISLGVAVFVQYQALTNPLAINDDVRNQVYWMARLLEPGLYPNDYIAAYFTQNSLVSPILWAIYWVGSHFMDPVRVSQLLPLALAPLATYFVYRFGENFAGKRYGFFAAFAFNLIVWLGRNLAGGLARAFAYPLLFGFLYFLSRKNRLGLALTAWSASLIYPPALFFMLGIWLVSFLPGFSRPNTMSDTDTGATQVDKPDVKSFLLGFGGGLSILIYRFVVDPINAQQFGSLINGATAALTPEFYTGGRVPIFHYFRQPVSGHGVQALASELLARMPLFNRLLPLVGILAIYWLYQRFIAPKARESAEVPAQVWQTGIAAIGMYLVAWIALFYLYVPERYLQLGIPVLYTFLFAGLLEAISRVIQRSHVSGKAKLALTVAPLILSVAIFSQVWDQNLMLPTQDTWPIMTYLQKTPVNTMVAATPGIASDIPIYARRSVVLSQEGYIPFHDRYFREMKVRLKDFLLAYYSRNPETLAQFIRQYKVDYLLVNAADFTPYRLKRVWKKYYHSFPRAFYQQLIQDAQTQDFILSHPKPSCAVVQSGDYTLIPAKAILNGDCFGTASANQQ